jgi:ankyrin repeat protein
MNWRYKDTWASITATGAFDSLKEGPPNELLRLAEIEKYDKKFGLDENGNLDPDSEFIKYVEKYESKHTKKHKNKKPHLFLYVSEDDFLESKSTENIQVKVFSPSQNTVFDVLDYVFELPPLPKNYLNDEQKKFFEDFENKTKEIWQEKTIVPMIDTYRDAIQKINTNPQKSLFIHGINGCRKSYLAYQIARSFVWDDKKYTPIWIDFKNDKATKFSLGSGGAKLAGEIWEEFSEKLTEDKSCLVVIDGLDIGGEILDDFLLEMSGLLVHKDNIRIIYTSIIVRHSTEFDKYFIKYPPPKFTKDELIYFVDMILKQHPVAKSKIDSIRQGNEKDRELYDRLIEFLCKNCANLPSMVQFIINGLNRPKANIESFLNNIETSSANVTGVTNALVDIYKNIFNLLSDNAKYLLLYMLNFNFNEYTPIEKLKDNIENITSEQPECKKKIRDIVTDKDDVFGSNDVFDELFNNQFILIDKEGVKIKDSMLYKMLLSEDIFAAKDLRERLVSEEKMLKYYVMQFIFMDKKENMDDKEKDERREQIEMLEFRLNRFGNRLYDIIYEGGCNILHGIARFCDDKEIFDFLWDKYPKLFYYIDENNGKKPVVDEMGQTAFHYAAAENQKDILEWFLENPGKVLGTEYYLNFLSAAAKSSAVHFAAEFNKKLATMEFLLSQKTIVINNENNKGYTPLHYVCWKNTPDIVKLLLEKLKEGGYNILDASNQNPLHICFEYFDETKREIFEKGEISKIEGIIEKRTINDLKRIIDSIKKCVVEKDFKSILRGTDKDGNIPLHYALYFIYGNADMEEIKKLLTELDLSDKKLINAQNNKGFTPLHNAAMYNSNSPELVSFLVEKGAKINNHSNDKIYSIHYAAQYSRRSENVEIIAKILCGEKLNLLNVPDNRGFTPLHYAVRAGNTEMILALINLGANKNILDKKYGLTPLHLAVQLGISSSLIRLLTTSENINRPTTMEFLKSTPLLLAMHPPKVDRNIVLQLLRSDGVDVEEPDCLGNTPLHWAVINCRDDLDIIEKLITKNTINRPNMEGETPLLRAKTHLGAGHAVVQILECTGARL